MPPTPSCRRTGRTSRARRAVSLAEFLSDGARPLDHRTQLAERDVTRQTHEAAVGRDDETLDRNDLERPADPIGHEPRRLHFVGLDVDDADANLEGHVL